MRTLNAFALLSFVAMLAAGCGGSSSSGISPVLTNTPNPTPTPSQNAAKVLQANPGAICETLVMGELYTRTPPPLSCNGGSDPYTAYLDGSESTTPGGTLTYGWSFVSVPSGSTAQLSGANTANPTFVPDVPGPYVVQLVVSANGASSPRAAALVMALGDATLNPGLSGNPYDLHGGLTSNCIQCHTGSVNPTLLGKPSTHIATSNSCQSCHTPVGFGTVAFVDHQEVFGNCSDCHNGDTAIGKSANHIETTQECSDCHTTISFVKLNPDGTFDHAGITTGCSSCHNGTVAIGTEADPNPTGHPSISAECIACHTTVTFASPFPNHDDQTVVVPGTCGQSGCHDGSSIMADGTPILGKNSAPNPHPTTGDITVACDSCHNTQNFDLGNVFDHGVLARHPIECKSCHDRLSAIGIPLTGHVVTTPTSDCSDCHNTTNFAGAFVDHTSSAVTAFACTDCHNGTDAPGTPTTPPVMVAFHASPSVASQTCDACHSPGGSFSLATIDHSSFGTVGSITLPAEYASCSDCHDSGVATGKPTGHLDTTLDCGECHDPQRGDWLGAGYDHSALVIFGNSSTPSCSSCHDGLAAVGQSFTHVPEPMAGQDCLVCHGTGFSSFALPTFNHTSAGITDNCVSCHDGKAHDGVIVVKRPAGHIPTTLDCSSCHTDTTNGPGINGTPLSGFTRADRFINVVHPTFTTGCGTCHNGSYDNAIYGATGYPNDSVHATVIANAWECNACHATSGGFMETSPVNHQDPAIIAQPCINCHIDGQTSSPMGKSGGHPVTSDVCQDCHQAGGTFVAGFDHTTLNAGGVNQGLACTSCHNGTTATGKPTTAHLPTTRDCLSCHTGYPPSVSSFAGGFFDHTGPEMLSTQCMTCHNDTIAMGKTDGHIQTSADCGACHTTDAFTPATGFDHTGVTSGCAASGCHNSGNPGGTDVTDDPNPLPHIPIINTSGEVDCYNCHKNAGGTFAGAQMNHNVVNLIACESCHDGQHDGSAPTHIVTPKSQNHFVTGLATCASCHTSNTAWTTVAYTHPAGSNYPGDHSTRRITRCAQCHNSTPSNEDISSFPHPTYGTTCAACHASQGTREHGNPLPTRYYSCGNSGCHRVSSSSF